MIKLQNISVPSEHVRTRAEAMSATEYDAGRFTISYEVVPLGTKDRRLVLFDLKREAADCLSLENGEVCEANRHGKLCAHVLKASQVMEASISDQAA